MVGLRYHSGFYDFIIDYDITIQIYSITMVLNDIIIDVDITMS